MSQYGVQLKSTEDTFYELCRQNPNLRLERTAIGEVIAMPPTGWETGNVNAEINTQLGIWSKQNGTGKIGESSTGYKLANGAIRSPDASWIEKSRLAQVSLEERKKALPLLPNFAIELRSPSDDLNSIKAKMDEYIANGLLLGWLIDPEEKTVYVYRPNVAVQKLVSISEISADPELPGFVLDLTEVWNPQL